MKASLDTNIIIHFYKANLQTILFDLFDDGVFIYEQIREVELKNHAGELLEIIDEDIIKGKIEVYSDIKLIEPGVKKIFDNKVNENKWLYGLGDMGEVYAISLAQTIGGYFLVTDDVKQGGPYMSLLQLKYDDIIPFNFVDVLIVRFLMDKASARETIDDFNSINQSSELNWNLKTYTKKFLGRFFYDSYKEEDVKFIKDLIDTYNIKVRSKFMSLQDEIRNYL